MSEIVKTITSLVGGAIMVFGINIILYGHITPGGGFSGGLILAFVFILYFLAFGKDEALARLPLRVVHLLDSFGAICFLFLGVLGFFIGGKFLINFLRNYGTEFHLISGGIIPLENIAIGVKVGAAVFLVFAMLAIFRREKSE